MEPTKASTCFTVHYDKTISPIHSLLICSFDHNDIEDDFHSIEYEIYNSFYVNPDISYFKSFIFISANYLKEISKDIFIPPIG